MAARRILRVNGVEHDLDKVGRKITVWQYLELEDATGITVDDLEDGKLSSARALAAYAFLIRRHSGDDVTFEQTAQELTPDAFEILGDEEAEPDPTPGPTDSARAESDDPAPVAASE